MPDRLVGFGRRQQIVARDIILAIDQSGSMASSVVYASVFGAVLASIRAVRTSVVVFDTSLADLGHLGALEAVPGWPGAEAYPAQPMVTQMRAVLSLYQAAGGKYTEHVLARGGHSPHLERPKEFHAAVTEFLSRVG